MTARRPPCRARRRCGWRRTAGDLLARLVARHRDDRSAPMPAAARRTGRPRRRRRRRRCRRAAPPRPPRASRWPSRRRRQQRRDHRASGIPSVFTRLPSAWVTRAYSAWPLTVKPRFTQADCMPARQCAQVLSQWSNGTITKSPGRNEVTSADLLDHADALVADRAPRRCRSRRGRPQVGAADAARGTLTTASVGGDRGSGTPRRGCHGGMDRGGTHGRILHRPATAGAAVLRYLTYELPWSHD